MPSGGLTGKMLSAREVDLSGSTLTGPLQVSGADITGQLICRGAKLTGQDNYALLGSWMKAGAGVVLGQGFTAAGAIRLVGADITGQLDCGGAELNGQDNDGYALVAGRMKVGGSVHLGRGFTAAGAISLVGADIAGQLNCSDAELNGQDNDDCALVGESMKVGGSVLLDQEFTAAGTIALQSVHVGESVVLAPAALAGSGMVALDATVAQITGSLMWQPTSQVFGQVNLEGATVGRLVDDWATGRPGGFWPLGGQLRLNGFTYEASAETRPP